MSTKHRIRLAGSPVTRQLPTPAGGVKLETFVPWRLVQRGVKRRLITPLDAPQAFEVHATWAAAARAEVQDTALMRALGLAYHWQRLLDERRVASAAEIAKAEGLDASQVHRLMRLTLLSPQVLERLLTSPDIRVEMVFGRPWPYGWAEQLRVLASSIERLPTQRATGSDDLRPHHGRPQHELIPEAVASLPRPLAKPS